MIKEKNGFSVFLSKNLEMYKKYQSEIIKPKEKDKIFLQEKFKELLSHYEDCLKSNKELTKDDQDKILQLIILTLSIDKANNTIENSLEAIEILASNDFFDKDIINKNMKDLGKNLMNLYDNYSSNVKLMMQEINLIKVLIDSNSFHLKNESFYNIIVFLLLNIIQINNSDAKTTTYQVRKLAKLVLDKCLEQLIIKSSKINYDVEGNHIYNYYICYGLNNNLYNNFINQITKYLTDNCIDELVNKNRKIIYDHKNEKGIDKGKYNWCFVCRSGANYFSEELSLPICSKKCENIIKYTEKLLNPQIYYDSKTYSVFDDYINITKLIAYNILCFLEQYLYKEEANINKNFQEEIIAMNDKLNYFIEIVHKLISQPIIKDSEKNKNILELIKDYIFPFLIELSDFYKRANNMIGLQNNLKLFELLINEMDDWYMQNSKEEIYTFTKKIIFPFFSEDIHQDDFVNNSNNHLNHLAIKLYIIDLLSSNLLNFLFEMHANYDSHFYYKNLFLSILEHITNILYDSYDRKFNFESKIDVDLIHKIKMSSMNLIYKIINKIEELANELSSDDDDKSDNSGEEDGDGVKIDDKKILEYINLKTSLNESFEKFIVNPSYSINHFIKKNIIPQTKDFIQYKEVYLNNSMNISQKQNISKKYSNKRLRYKNNLPYFPQLFNPETDTNDIFNDFFSINFSLSLNYDDFTAYALALFIRLYFDDIMNNNIQTISNFFSTVSPLNMKVLFYYINSFYFKNYNILEGLHLIFYYLPLVNNAPVLEKIINIFSEKYIKDNFNIDEINMTNNYLNEYLIKICQMILDISFFVIEPKPVKEKKDKKKKINKKSLKTVNEYLSILKKDFDIYKDEEKLQIMDNSYIYEIYNLSLANPINFFKYPNSNSLVDSNGNIKSSNDLYGKFPSSLFTKDIINSINKNNTYIIEKNMNKESLKNIINCSWGFFIGIFSKQISYYNDEDHVKKGLENLLNVAKVCGMMKNYTISDAYLKSVLNLTGLCDSAYNKLNFKNILAIKTLVEFVHNNGKYIYSSWNSIFSALSRLNQIQKCSSDVIYNIIKTKGLNKKHFIEHYTYNKTQVELIDPEPIYTITKELNVEILKQFVLDLIKVSEEEIDFFKNGPNKKNKERFFSYNKLVYVIDVNRERKNDESAEIQEDVKKFFVKLITENPLDDVLLNKVKESFKMIENKNKESTI